MLVAQVSTREEAMAALGAGADGVVLMGAVGTAAAPGGLADAVRVLDDLFLMGARAWVQASVPGLPGLEFRDAYAAAVAGLASAGADGLVVDDWGALALAWPVARAANMPVIAGGALAAPSSARRQLYERLGLAGAFLSPQLSVGQVVRAAQQSSLELWAYVHGRLDFVGESAAAAGTWCDELQRGKWALNGRGEPLHLLNLRTLAAVKPLRQLAAAGVVRFVVKAAGMGPVWTGDVCRVYRCELHRLAGAAGQPGVAEQFAALSATFNTGLSPGFYMGDQASDYTNRDHGGDEGIAVGAVESVRRSDGRVMVRFSRAVSGGGRLEARPPSSAGPGAVRLNPVDKPASGAWVAGDRAWVNTGGKVQPGYAVYMLSSQSGATSAAGEMAAARGPRPLDVEALAVARLEAPFSVTYRTAGAEATRQGPEPQPCAGGRCLSPEWLSAELVRAGGRPINVQVVKCDVDEGVMVPPPDVNALRKQAMYDLVDAILAPRRRRFAQGPTFDDLPGQELPGEQACPAAATRIMALVMPDVDPQLLARAGAHGVCLDCDTGYRVMVDYFARARDAGLTCWYDTTVEVLDDDMDYARSQMARAREAGAELLIVEDLALLSDALDLAPQGAAAGPGCQVRDAWAAQWVVGLGACGYIVPFSAAGVPPAPVALPAVDGIIRGIVAGGRAELGVSRYCVLGAELGSVGKRGRAGGFARGECTAPCREGEKPVYLVGDGGNRLYLTFDRSCRAHVYAPERAAVGGIERCRAMGYDWVWLDLRTYNGGGAANACARFAALEA